ncbi:MAG: hypothetical protein ACXAAH_09545 [Promethearchaeota archaeon]|jgi:hypothetical protein
MKTEINFNGQSILITSCEFTGTHTIEGINKTFRSFKTAKNYVYKLLSFQVISQEVKTDVRKIRNEMKKSKPNCTKIFELISGTKYTGELIDPEQEAIQEEILNEKILSRAIYINGKNVNKDFIF